uniref:Adaptor related protein complex 5 subunit sigma 1 n=1 Tax=Loxodonta africana TaxID=9785 RepID=G3U6L9_LOXAF
MVHAFLIYTLRAPHAEDTGFCRVLYSCVFGAEKSPDDPRPHGAERDRLLRKEQILAVARQAESMCRLQQQASGHSSVDLPPQSSDEPASLHEAPHGAFRLAAGDPFQEPRTVVWLGVLSLGFALVLDAHENLLLAEGTLRLLARFLFDHLRLLAPVRPGSGEGAQCCLAPLTPSSGWGCLRGHRGHLVSAQPAPSSDVPPCTG